MFFKPSEEQRKLEQDIRSEINKDTLWEHVENLCKIGEKFSGTPESKKAVDYIVKSVSDYGIPVKIHEFDSIYLFI